MLRGRRSGDGNEKDCVCARLILEGAIRESMVIDTHAHFWRLMPEANTDPGSSHEPIGVDEFVRHMDEAGVDKLLQITRSIMGFDNSYSLESVANYPERIRVLGRINPRAPDLLAQMDGWLKQSGMVGIRLMAVNAIEASCFDDGTIDRLWPEAETRAIPISVYAPERSKLIGEVATRHPDLQLVVDHIGMRVFDIFERPPSMEDWPNLMALSRCPNITIKVSGIPEAMVERHPFPKSQRCIQEIYDRFGADRMMWGSNYPPTTQICTYRQALDLLSSQCTFLTAADKDKILAGTATKVFRLPW
jgi:L-fuconolactonase